MSILVVGSVAYDSIKTPFGAAERVLGGSATYFSVAASYFTRVGLVACVGNDFDAADVELFRSHGIDLKGLETHSGKTFFWQGEYGYDLNDARTLNTQLNVFADFSPRIPAAYQRMPYVFLGNIDPGLQRQVLSQMERPELVACDTMNYWIEGHFSSLQETLKQVDILIVNDAETRQLAQEPNLVKAARKIFTWGPRILVVKWGEYGVMMFHTNPAGALDVFAAPAYPLEDVFDPTGAGDSFAGGFMGFIAGSGRTDPEALRQAIIFGSVMASFNVEKFSLGRLRELTFTEITERFRQLQEMTRFEDFHPNAI